MADRVAVYIDFDNVVISRYDQVHGDGAWRKDDARGHAMNRTSDDPVSAKLATAKIDLGAIIDYCTSFGIVAMTRAYADWSVPANAAYRHDLVGRAVDLVQLFPASGTKNGADIRLAVDAVEDLTRHPDITHVAVVAGDSDYVPLVQRCKRLGRYVVGIGVLKATSTVLVSACDEFEWYEKLPGLKHELTAASTSKASPAAAKAPAKGPTAKKAPAKKASTAKTPTKSTQSATPGNGAEPREVRAAVELLVRAVRLGSQKSDDGWIYAAGVKSQMQRLDPAFKEKSFGFSTFRDFVESRKEVESKVENGQLRVRLL